ncbi:Two component regulator propeller [Tautonia plasticadhaerens]|uniref:Two component regulator propeller n=2 Tax=Tautonia plasticadhaerens TaxID=2527974 RepID=A0A518H1T7_9BACT|nr:Two component regulator propeller [Tautonia plasticadhaerens]
MTRGQVQRALAAVVVLALVPATSCTTKQDATRSKLNDSAIGPPARLRFKTVRSILEDSKGNYWFGSWNEGVARFDGESLTYFTEEDGLSDNQIRSIHEDQNGVVWFEGGVEISGFDGEKIITPTNKNYTSRGDWQLSSGDLWFKEDGSSGATDTEAQPGAYRYDGETFTYLAYPVPSDRAQRVNYATTGIARGKSGRLWFATYDAVFGYDGQSFTIIDDGSLGLNESTGRLHVRSVLEDSKGRLWIGNNGIGVILHDGHTATLFTQENGLGRLGPHGGRTVPQPGDVTDGSPSLHRVFSIGEDRDGNIWFGTVEQGAWRYDGRSLRNYTAEDGLTSKDIMGIYTDRHGDLWLAGNGVFKFNGASFERIL